MPCSSKKQHLCRVNLRRRLIYDNAAARRTRHSRTLSLVALYSLLPAMATLHICFPAFSVGRQSVAGSALNYRTVSKRSLIRTPQHGLLALEHAGHRPSKTPSHDHPGLSSCRSLSVTGPLSSDWFTLWLDLTVRWPKLNLDSLLCVCGRLNHIRCPSSRDPEFQLPRWDDLT